MIKKFLKSEFVKMPWKNGKGITTQICIEPASAKVDKGDFLYRLSSAPIDQETEFSQFAGMNRILIPIKGAGFRLNDKAYAKYEVAQFSGNDEIYCSLLKGPVIDFGVIYDPTKVKAQARVLHLKSDMTFSLEPNKEYFITLLDGVLNYNGKALAELETLHYQNEINCELKPTNSAMIFYLSLEII
ncbi:MAG: HutD family protein [Pseudobdellovibrio sp.]